MKKAPLVDPVRPRLEDRGMLSRDGAFRLPYPKRIDPGFQAVFDGVKAARPRRAARPDQNA